MAYRKKTMYRKKGAAPRRRTYKRRAAARSRPIRKVVRAEIQRAAEPKTIQTVVTAHTFYSSTNALAPANNVLELGADGVNIAINQGTGQANRVGNRIRVKSLWMKGVITPLPYDVTTNPNPRPVQLKMVIFYDRVDPMAMPNPFAGGAAGPFQGGGATNAFQNDLVDMVLPFNTDRYRIFATRTFKLGYSQYAGTAASAANQTAYQAYSNNDYRHNYQIAINLTKFYPKNLRFNDNNAIPTNRGLFVMFYYANADGSQAGNGWAQVGFQYMQSLTFTDL